MFQDRLQKLREQHGYSVKEAAAALHLPYTTYNNYEKNTREPNGEILCRIAAFFSVSLDYLLGATSTHSNQTVSPEEQAVYTKLQALDSHGKRLVSMVLEEEYIRVPFAAAFIGFLPERVCFWMMMHGRKFKFRIPKRHRKQILHFALLVTAWSRFIMMEILFW